MSQKDKKFKYRLETVLKVRGIKEKKEQEEFAKKQRAYLEEKRKEEQIDNEKKAKSGELRTILKKGPISDFERVMRRRSHLGVLKDQLDTQIEEVKKAQEKVDKQRENLIDAMKNRKIIEKDKEHKFKSYDKEMKKLEGDFLDEIATVRHEYLKRQD
ncbi:MAG: flagellar FliJ family protein [bacterium]